MDLKLDVKNKIYLHYCDLCQKTIKGSTYKYKSHLYQQHKGVKAQFKCEYCLKEYFRRDMYYRHMNQHTDAKQDKKLFICDHCDRGFAEKRNLIIHLKVHDDNPAIKYQCMACRVSYCEERLLKYHIRKTHYNLNDKTPDITKEPNETWIERVNQSEVCVEMTQVNNNVVSIKKVGSIKVENTNIKKTNSDNKKLKFKQYITSVFAQQDHSQYSKATCDYCKKEMLKKSLLSHIRERHLKLKRFKCDVCKCEFSRHYQMVDHICGKFKSKNRN